MGFLHGSFGKSTFGSGPAPRPKRTVRRPSTVHNSFWGGSRKPAPKPATPVQRAVAKSNIQIAPLLPVVAAKSSGGCGGGGGGNNPYTDNRVTTVVNANRTLSQLADLERDGIPIPNSAIPDLPDDVDGRGEGKAESDFMLYALFGLVVIGLFVARKGEN